MDDRINVNANSDDTSSDAAPETIPEDDIVETLPSNQQQPDEAAYWKNKYARMAADLENTKKRLARAASQEVQAEKKTLLRDILPVADGLDLAILHISHEADSRNFLQGIEMIRNILEPHIGVNTHLILLPE